MITAARKHLAFCLMAAFAFAAFAQEPAHTVVPPGSVALFRLRALDATETVRTATGRTVTVDNPALAYVGQFPDSPNQLVFVPKATPPAGTTATVTVTINATNDRGAALPPLVLLFDMQGPPLPPTATHIAVVEGPTVRDAFGYSPPPDPGAATVAVVF